ncbi:MAG: cache domain-containing protein [Candidatus Cloacimonetes bacterium]|nr:cache domain-containing protein [Candidatus Cloacimonadota bacterium]
MLRMIISVLVLFVLLSCQFKESCADNCLTEQIEKMKQENNEEIAKTAVHITAQGMGEVCVNIESEEQVSFIRNFINPIRFYADKTGYFYVYNYDCINIAHATQKDLEGKNLYDHQDSQGKYVIRELSKKAKEGGGFVEFYWQKPNTTEEFRKIGYVEPIPGTDYFIGTGVYAE